MFKLELSRRESWRGQMLTDSTGYGLFPNARASRFCTGKQDQES